MKKSELRQIIKEEIQKLEESSYDVDSDIEKDIKKAKSIKEIEKKVEQYGLNKGQLMNIAYDGNTKNVDTAVPSSIYSKLDKHGGTFWFVMDYQNSSGKLVHLGEKIIGKKMTNWNEKI